MAGSRKVQLVWRIVSDIASAKKHKQHASKWRRRMFTKIKTAVASAFIGLSAIAAVPASAQESGIYLNFGGRGDYFGDTYRDGYRYRDNYRYREGYREDRWDRDRWTRRCTPGRALNKAERMGLHRARIADVDRRTITVRGRSRGERVFVTFARAPHCPVIG
jgi:hypothetical protein